MFRRPLTPLVLLVLIAACGRTVPPDPAIGFDRARALPPTASFSEVVEAGGRVLDAAAVRTVVATMGEDAFLQAIGGAAGQELVLRRDGAACLDDAEDAPCRRIVADGMDYRVFRAEDGTPSGTLGPSPG